ncbi:hypothetical protein Trydic_g15278 [Trypoxylus dichotomus]
MSTEVRRLTIMVRALGIVIDSYFLRVMCHSHTTIWLFINPPKAVEVLFPYQPLRYCIALDEMMADGLDELTWIDNISRRMVYYDVSMCLRPILDEHLIAKHNYRRDEHSCDLCPKTYSYRPSLIKHKAIQHGEHKKYHCENCTKLVICQIQAPPPEL